MSEKSPTVPSPAPVADAMRVDGIRFADRSTPAALYIAAFGVLAWAVVYFVFVQWSPASRDPEARLSARQAAVQRALFAGVSFENDPSTVLGLAGDAEWMTLGRALYSQHCASCHGGEGGGLIGPNLCDDRWKQVRDVTDVATVIVEGAAAGAMPAWGARLSTNEIVVLSAYVASLRGSEPAGAMAPEGDLIPEWSAD